MENKLTLEKKEVVPTYGGSRIQLTYEFEHNVADHHDHKQNTYQISVELRGLDSAEPYLEWESLEVLKRYHNNEDTLTDEGLMNVIPRY